MTEGKQRRETAGPGWWNIQLRNCRILISFRRVLTWIFINNYNFLIILMLSMTLKISRCFNF